MITTDMGLLWLVTALALGLAHCFEWPWGKPPHRLLAYAAGTLLLNIPFSTWLLLHNHDHLQIVLAQWGNVLAGGAVVILLWGWDALLHNWRRRVAAEKSVDADDGDR